MRSQWTNRFLLQRIQHIRTATKRFLHQERFFYFSSTYFPSPIHLGGFIDHKLALSRDSPASISRNRDEIGNARMAESILRTLHTFYGRQSQRHAGISREGRERSRYLLGTTRCTARRMTHRMAAMIQMLRCAMFTRPNKSQRRRGKSDGHYY